jgi:hypothetical protein
MIASLLKNDLRLVNKIYIYVDNSIDEGMSATAVSAVHELALGLHLRTNTTVIVRLRPYNIGLRNNILSGLSDVFSDGDAAIVIEDDLLLHTAFCSYMCEMLHAYKEDMQVGHINGHNPIALRGKSGHYFSNHMDCWGWATWKDRWNYYERNPKILLKRLRRLSKEERARVTYGGMSTLEWQLKANISWRKETWAVNWGVSLALMRHACIYPSQSLVLNIGEDGSGTNCKPVGRQVLNTFEHATLNFKTRNIEDEHAFETRLKEYFSKNRVNFYNKIVYKFHALRVQLLKFRI